MKALLVNGSPRPHGNTVKMLERLAEDLPGETVLLQAYDPQFSPCIDCRWCWLHEGCAIDDGFQAGSKKSTRWCWARLCTFPRSPAGY